ncbi:MAG: tRNA pseudouridine(38-40) synthase TruA, partial [Thermoanaerobaculia bacterium]
VQRPDPAFRSRPPTRPSGAVPPRPLAPRFSGQVLRATLEYDGSRYRGWQAQINARTVQGVLYHAVEQVFGTGVRIQGAGRTDAGVHALAQVASLHLPAPAQTRLDELQYALNDRLPPDIHILSLTEAHPSFHARHSATLRTYRYRISRRRTAFGKPFVWWIRDRIDLGRMEHAAALLVGRHDFSSFCENAEGHDSTLVEVDSASVTAAPGVPDLLLFRITASHFLWKMVRRVVGTLVEIGTGRIKPDAMEGFLATRSTEPATWTAPPSGLFLESVLYPGDPPPPAVDPLRPAF